jgi:hypothetical protein
MQIWYRDSLREKNSRTTHPTGRAHQPCAVSVIVTQRTNLFPSSETSTVISSSMCQFSKRSVNLSAQLVRRRAPKVYLSRGKARVTE